MATPWKEPGIPHWSAQWKRVTACMKRQDHREPPKVSQRWEPAVGTLVRYENLLHPLPKSGFPWDTEIGLWVDFTRSLEQVNFRQYVHVPSALLSSIIKSQNLWASLTMALIVRFALFRLFHYNITFPPPKYHDWAEDKKDREFSILLLSIPRKVWLQQSLLWITASRIGPRLIFKII